MVGNLISVRGGVLYGIVVWCVGVWDVCGLKTVCEVCLVRVLRCVYVVIGVLWGGCCNMFEYTRVCTLVSVQVCKPGLMHVEARAGVKCLPLLLSAVFSGNMTSP